MNPAVDLAVALETLVLGDVNRCTVDNVDPGGKGVNVSRVLIRIGCPTVALGFAGGSTGDFLLERLKAEDVPHRFFPTDEMTRSNTMIWEHASGRRTQLRLPGAHVSQQNMTELEHELDLVQAGEIVVLGGSLPPGLGTDTYARLSHRLAKRGARVCVDTSGKALDEVTYTEPLLIKPNVEEAQELVGRALTSDAQTLEAALELHRRGVTHVVISQGERGAIGVGPFGAWKAIPPKVEAKSTVGSGDSMVAGIIAGLNGKHSFAESLIIGTAAGAATAMSPGTQLCSTSDVKRFIPKVVLHELLPAAACA